MSGLRRFIAALHAVTFALSIGAPGLMHPCPTHAAVAEAPAASVHAAHGATHHQSDDAPEPARDDCCCPGPQCGGQAVAILPARTGDGLAALPRATVTAGVVPGLRIWRPAHVLPFATAPPASIA